MEFRLAEQKDLDEMCRITEEAKEQLRRLGLDQWQKGYPSREVWEMDIEEQMAWLAVEEGQILGVFAFQVTPDISYGEIEGAWLTDSPYASMHRVCVSDSCKGKGVAGQMFRYGFSMAEKLGFDSVRIDTHPENLPMQRALKKAGFAACGTIYLKGGPEMGDARIGFEHRL
jgi:ribosomal protein S18 acetylase RimI-like enzyme